MKTNVEIFSSLLEKYNLRKVIDKDTQKNDDKKYQQNLKIILKKSGHYSLYFIILLYLKKISAKLGFTLTFLQTKILFFIIATVFAVTTFTGGYYILNNYIFNKEKIIIPVPQEKKITIKPEEKKIIVKSEPVRKKNEQQKPLIGLTMLKAQDKEISKKITQNILKNIANKTGKNKISMIQLADRKEVINYITGSIRHVDNVYYLTVKIISSKNNTVINVYSEKAMVEDKIDDACKKISDKIISEIKL